MMNQSICLHPDAIRTLFSRAMSDMYKAEVPLYGKLTELVAAVNAETLRAAPALAARLHDAQELERLEVERHGAVRVGTPLELATLRRLFAVMGMQPVGYYDLSAAGVPVQATAFRAVDEASLRRNPFRIFCSLLRPELIADGALRGQALSLLARRRIFTPRCLELIEQAERHGGLSQADAEAFVVEALETFRWHAQATVDLETYQRLRAAHALVADIVCFKGPHINHLTPRTLDIDAAQARMRNLAIPAKETIEGPPRRAVPILLRQTSFLAMAEPVRFVDEEAAGAAHTARFGEIEQRGCALTRKGRGLYDRLLGDALAASATNRPADEALATAFRDFPDDLGELHRQGLAFVHYRADVARAASTPAPAGASPMELVEGGWLRMEPLTYEDFLPVSAAGIFRSNLGGEVRTSYGEAGSRQGLEDALGTPVADEITLYEAAEAASLTEALHLLKTQVAGLAP
jgi:uncharacterized glyoxalase superfamily metalloenzyme YdcJ